MKPKYRTGVFGDITKARVSALKKSRGWTADGIAGRPSGARSAPEPARPGGP